MGTKSKNVFVNQEMVDEFNEKLNDDLVNEEKKKITLKKVVAISFKVWDNVNTTNRTRIKKWHYLQLIN